MHAAQTRKIILILFITFLSSCSQPKQSVPGYIEGEYTYISSSVGGTLFQLIARRGQSIKKNMPLYQLDPEPQRSSVAVSKANIANLQAQVELAKIQLDRQKQLFHKNASSKEAVDQATADYISKTEQLAANRAQLTESEWALKQKAQYSPVEGDVSDTYYRQGETVPENRPVLAILDPANIKVLFYVPETSLNQIKIGQVITFSCDGCKTFTSARISFISPEAEFTPPVIYSKDTRYKLVYLVRASMPKTIARAFHPGQPIDVYLPS